MADEKPTPAAQQPGASDAATPKPAQTPEDIQKIRDGIFKEAREAYEPKLEKAKAKIGELESQFKAERDWRINMLDGRAKDAGVTETIGRIAKEKGPVEYEQVISEFEKLKATPAAPAVPKPAPLPGGEVGGSQGINLNLDLLDPATNPGGAAAAYKQYELACKQYTRRVVDDALAKKAKK